MPIFFKKCQKCYTTPNSVHFLSKKNVIMLEALTHTKTSKNCNVASGTSFIKFTWFWAFGGCFFMQKKYWNHVAIFSMKIKQILVCSSINNFSILFWQIPNIIFLPTYKFSVGKKYFIVGRKEPFIREIFFSSSLKIVKAQFNHTQWFKIQKSSI